MITEYAVLILMTFRSAFCSLKKRIKVHKKSALIEPQKHKIRRLIEDDKQGRYLFFEYVLVQKRISGIV